MPTATDLVTDLPADFEVFGQAVATSMADLLGGTSGQILAKNSNTDMDFVWVTNDVGDITAVTAGTGISGGGTSGAVTITNSMATEITAKGDLIAGTGSATFDNIPVGNNGETLVADSSTSTGLKWAAPATGMSNPMTNTGDTIYSSSGSTPARLGIGSTGQVLTVASGVPSWATPAGGGGKVLQVINATTSTNVTSASSVYANTGLTATITPTLNTSKILVLVNQAGCGKQSSDTALQLQLLRGATVLAKIEGIGGYTGTAAQNFIGSVSSSYLDAPATTSATTYKTQMASFGGTGDSCTQQQSSVSTITLLEIGA